jgi:DNA-binding CsgD family transcriptional regulator
VLLERQDLLARTLSELGKSDFAAVLSDWLAAELVFDNVTILAYRDDTAPIVLYAHAHDEAVHRHLHSIYTTGIYQLDPYFELHMNRASAGCYALKDIAPDHFYRNDYFLHFYEKTTIIDEIAFVAYPLSDISLHICIGRDGSSGLKFSNRDIKRANALSQIVLALIEQHWPNVIMQVVNEEEPKAEPLRQQILSVMQKSYGVELTGRQAEVAALILQGHSTPSIALNLGISAQTVKVFRKQLYRRCNISSQSELFALFLPALQTPR